ncbi:bifunctional UDP-N-acetylglucosamine diphosphorylase/glucosamine-1-phosphate N-acetyltransferase GlmU [Cardiobacterium sp. Marseille-Q4385]|uniref:bifunctional UDP-N-acetylglucosamine diphosphorylase/glucosamine-1-phosphate N-acetyltransferase GlmU n=1 Tax=Cardiobacterium sp. Marseille-Q4385 TaxID=2866573 RepID=UPI001CE3C5A2|nr:bifunctional UDP-N-acetylglucosamine diphosphorylase/glucosamine-1-phosphate N-acetyltransferase GlmU [Cardiobacterium sp. Marseille-Q4385]
MRTLALILAAGKGTRMRSAQAKVLQPVGGKAMIVHLLETLQELTLERTAVVFGYQGEQLRACIEPAWPQIQWIAQTEQRGTGHAVQMAMAEIAQTERTLILFGDTPLVRASTLQRLLDASQESGFALLSAVVDNPFGYGRIVRDADGSVSAVVEEKDASETQRAITEINTGMMVVARDILTTHLPQLQNNNAQGEYYLPDLVALHRAAGGRISAIIADDAEETMGINTRAQQAQAEAVYRRRQAQALLDAGVTLIDPARIDIHGTVSAGRDVVIEANVVIKGTVSLGDNVYIESGCVLDNCTIGAHARVYSHSRLEHCSVGANAQVGPFARLRPKTVLDEGVRIGNFVETKAATIGKGSKVNHLSYIGDAVIGSAVNIGAGTITCNYDGANKYRTTLGDRVFIGSNSALVAPVNIGDGATIGAGSVITKDVPAEQLALTRSEQKIISGWQRPVKKAK